MAKGVSIRFQSYEQTIPALLEIIKLQNELKKYDRIIIKPYLSVNESQNTNTQFVEEVLKFCINNKSPVAEVFIAEGSEDSDTLELFEHLGYKKLAEKYAIGLVDLNETEIELVQDENFLRFPEIKYPRILQDSFIISLAKLAEHTETELTASLPNMLGAFPASHYRGFFSQNKNKIRKWPIKYSIHDILKCKIPQFAVLDASSKGAIIAGQPIDVDKRGAILLGKDWRSISYLKLIDESIGEKKSKTSEIENASQLTTQ